MGISSGYWKKKKENETLTPSRGSGSLTSGYYKRQSEIGSGDDDLSMFNGYWKRMNATDTQVGGTTLDDIGPVKKQKWYEGYFDKGAFEDGYQFGDLTKTVWGTTRDVLSDIQVGAFNIAENAIDSVATQLARVPGWEDELSAFVAKDIIDEKKLTGINTASMAMPDVILRIIQGEDWKDVVFGDGYEESSVLGDKGDSLAQSGGQLALQYAMQGLGVPWWVTSAVSSYGSQAEQAFQEGATAKEANVSALISTGAEVLSEKIFGGFKFQGKALSDGLSDIISRGVSNKLLKGVMKLGLDAGGESIEEVFSEAASRFGQWLTYQDDKTIGEMLASEEAIDQYIEAAIGGGLLGGGNTALSITQNTMAGRDPVSGLNATEEQVVRDLFDSRVADEAKDGKVSEFRKNEIWDEVIEQMDRGEIAIDDIERILGGDTYKSYQDTVKKFDDTWNEFDALQNMKRGDMTGKQVAREAELRKIIEEDLAKSTAKEDLARQLESEVYSVAKDSRLMESYNERVRRGQAFEADVSKYSESERKTIQDAIDSGILNNTRKTHEFVDWVAKVAGAKGIEFKFTNNENLRGTQFEVKTEDGKTMLPNGYRDGNTIGINTNSKKSVNVVAGHEITHVLEGTPLYQALQDAVFRYAVAKDGQAKFDQRLKSVEDLYKGVSTDAKGELTADLVGEYLFTDKDFIKRLTTENKSLAKKVFDEIKHLWKLATAGSREKRELEMVKKAFEDAYREVGKNSNKDTADSNKNSNKGDVQHSLSEDADSAFEDAVFNGDTETAQRMLDEAAEKAGYTVKAYHGTRSGEFYVFDKNRIGANYSGYNASGGGFDFATDENSAFRWGGKALGLDPIRTIPVYLKAEKTFYNYETVPKDLEDTLPEGITDAERAEAMAGGYAYRRVLEKYGIDFKKTITSKGYDSYSMYQGYENIAVYDPSQIKSAKIETYDDDGAFIPLSERFNTDNPDIRFSLSEDSDGRQLSPGIVRRFENSKVVDENGNLKVVYHGTASGEFTIFDKSKGSVEGDFGSGFYFTDNESDVSEHYEGGGPDFENKVARLAEQIEAEEDIEYPEAEARAREELYNGSHKFEVYLNIENPAIVGETILLDPDEYFSEYSEDDFDSYEDYEAEVEQLVTDAIDNAIWEVERNVDLYNSDGLADVLWSAFSDGGIGIEELKGRINELYLEDSNGNIVGNEVARQIIESLGYDGIIDPTVAGKWNMDIEDGTTHYIVFKPNQIKAVTNQNPTDNPDIHRSLSGKNEHPTRQGNYHVTGEDIALGTPYSLDDIAPVAPKKTPNIVKDSRFIPGAKKNDGVLSWAKEHLLDNGMVFEDLAKKADNRDLEAKWNFIRNAPSAAQHLIGNGDKASGVKALKSIIDEVDKAGKTDSFNDYLLHFHNIDRMSLKSRFPDSFNKPVFGDRVTAEDSMKRVEELEKANPEFKAWANEVYKYNDFLRSKLVDAGIITQETSDLWADMYPHYVPIYRDGEDGFSINDSIQLGVNAPVKRATGGDSKMLNVLDAMASRTLQTFKAVAKNNFGVELMNTLGSVVEHSESHMDEFTGSFDMDSMFSQSNGIPTYTVYQGGERATFEITDEMYEAMKPKKGITQKKIPVLSHINSIFRGLTTQYNPVFALTNPIKDVQEVLLNSQHPGRTYANILSGRVLGQMVSNGKYYQEYLANGGKTNTYFDDETKTFKEEPKAKQFLDKVFAFNDYIEMTPRLAEYIASREAGKGIEESMLDAARVTTNFSAGGDVTKFLNRNGATFLNASVQGAIQQVRNVREANQKGLMGYVGLATRWAIGGLAPVLLNNLMWDDDEEYEDLADYVKQDYYIVGKYGDGKFIRIPKGRALAVLQEAMDLVMDTATGDDEVDMARYLALGKMAIENIAPNNPMDNNIFAPIKQVATNKTWYGEDLVPSRLADLPAAEQYDEKTDSISKWLGQTFNLSPYKINYLLNQYSGGIGDFFLPMLTPRAESGDDSLLGTLTAPYRDKFTTDSVLNSQTVSDFYDTCDELERNANSVHATEDDAFKYMYMRNISYEAGDLYAQKREIQNSDLPDSEKYELTRELQAQINALMEEALGSYQNPHIDGIYAEVGSKRFNMDQESGNWYEIKPTNADGSDNWYYQMEQEVTQGLGISYGEYWNNREEYNFAYQKPGKYAIAQSVGGYQDYLGYSNSLYDIHADKDENGKSINGTRKKKVVEYINGLDCEYGMKLILYKSEYPSDDEYNYDIIEYLNSRDDISYEQMETILKELGFNVDSKGHITW